MKIYKDRRTEFGQYANDTLITVDGENFETKMLQKSLMVRNHSPTGFNWGYGGSGPHQLALALLLDITNDPYIAETHHNALVKEMVAPQRDEWEITEVELKNWLNKKQSELN